jgi:hypothetical protein
MDKGFIMKGELWRRAIVAALSGLLAPVAFGQVSFSNSTGLAYSQSFDGLANSGTGIAWANNNTSGLSGGSGGPSSPTTAGWYAWRSTAAAAPTTYSASAGTNTEGLYSFGSASATDRALGAYPNDTSGAYYIGLYLRYTGAGTLPTLSQLQVIYRGEIWRDDGGNLNTMAFEYQISSSAIAINAASGWNAVSALNFAYTGDGTSSNEDGNASGNFSQKNTLITGLTIADDNFIMLRWTLPNTGGADHGFAIDDVFVAVPEARTWGAGLLVGGLVLAQRYSSRRRQVVA